MSRQTLAIPMSQIIASDAPILSPSSPGADTPWDTYSPITDSFAFNSYDLPPSPPNSTSSTSPDSPIPTSRMLKRCISPDSGSESEQQLCLPTHQLFDFPEGVFTTSLYSPSSTKHQCSNNQIPVPVKRSASPAPGTTKKPRAGERINSKDFIPPDVSGLNKREARLVKNRAAAFLSRQRKREEFQCMEVRVAELEQENARLLALAKNGSGCVQSDNGNAEIERLRAQLAAAEERERGLSAELKSKVASSQDTLVKVEAVEPESPLSSPPRSTPIPFSHKSGASLGLMVLLCALPTLLSMPTQSALPTTFSVPIAGASTFSASSSAFDYNSLIPNDWDWSTGPSHGTMMDLDIDDQGKTTSSLAPTTSSRKLEFVDGALAGLGDLDISFDASPSDDRKILVRIHPSSPPSSRSQSPTFSPRRFEPSSLMWAGSSGSKMSLSQSASSFSGYSVTPFGYDTSPDPFLGIGSTSEFASLYPSEASSSTSSYGGDVSSSAEGFGFGLTGDSSGKRRIRIALKSMPAPGGEGGEWEVQVR